MSVLVTGAGGQLGYDLIRVLSRHYEVVAATRDELDVTDAGAVKNILRHVLPEIVIHAAAYTSVDLAEDEVDQAYQVNAIGTWNVATEAHAIGAKLVYISTDYVFDGMKDGLYDELDKPNPLNVYGNSKLLGEKFAAMLCSRLFIVRTSWLYGSKGRNFVTKVMDMSKNLAQIIMASDQMGSPTYGLDLAHFICELIQSEKYGIYHASNQGSCSRYDFAREILKYMEYPSASVIPVRAEILEQAAPRPTNSALAHHAIRLNGLTPLRDWRQALRHFLLHDDKVDLPKLVT
jgi:dTDP-4-dehydrorhamnose reductase